MKERLTRWFAAHPESTWGITLFVLAFLQYANTLGHAYTWDDDIVIVYNQRVQQGLAAIPDHFKFRARENFEDFTGYRPVTMTSFSIDIGLFGMRPWAGHLMNVLLFSLLCMVLFRTLRHLFPDFQAAYAFFIALLFLVHPIHVEAVANIKSRDEILALLFALLALQLFVRHYRTGHWGQLGLSALFLLLGALSKEGALTYFAIVPLTVVLLLEGNWKRKLVGLLKFPLILLGIVGMFLVLTGKLPGSPSPVTTKGFVESQTLGNCMAIPRVDAWQRIGNCYFLLFENVKKFFFPKDLVYFSGYNMYPLLDWTRDRVTLTIGWAVINLMAVFTVLFWRRLRPITYGFWYFMFTMVIYVQLPFFLLADTIADRFLFLPSVGLCIIVVDLMYRLLRVDRAAHPWRQAGQAAVKARQPLQGRKVALLGVMGVAVVTLAGMTMGRNRVWRDNLTLFSHDLPLLENCARAHYYYASELAKGYAHSQNQAQAKQEIIRHYRRAIEITPESYYAYVRLAHNYQRWQDYAAQVKLCGEALVHYPGQGELWHLKGMGLYYLGKYVEAVPALNQSRLLDPELDDNWEFLARAQERAGQYAAALATLEEALGRNSAYLLYYDVLSDTYFDAGDTTRSFEPILHLIAQDGQNPVWWRKLIGRYQMVGNHEAAAYYYQQAQAQGIQLQ